MDKNEIRNQIRKQKRCMTEEVICNKSRQISAHIWHLPVYRSAEDIYLYASFNQEVRTEEIFKVSRDLGKRVYLPRIEDNSMQFYEVEDLNEVVSGYQGIPEPVVGREASIPKQGAVFFTPGLAFDKNGNRIGYGSGFYDKYFSKLNAGNYCKLALAYDFQIYKELPAEKYDVAVDYIISPEGYISCVG